MNRVLARHYAQNYARSVGPPVCCDASAISVCDTIAYRSKTLGVLQPPIFIIRAFSDSSPSEDSGPLFYGGREREGERELQQQHRHYAKSS